MSIEDFKRESRLFFELHQTNEFDNEELEIEYERILNLRLKHLTKTEWDIEIIDGKIKLI